MTGPGRVRVGGDLFHPAVSEGAVYVGRSGPHLAASPFANPFRLKRGLAREHPLRDCLERGMATVMFIPIGFFDDPAHDLLPPVTPAIATATYRVWLNDQPELMARARAELAHRDLACWCPLPEPGHPDHCHAAALIEVTNA